jgi:hypothetical protein
MDLERRRPALYGPKQEVRHTVAPRLTIIAHEQQEVPALTDVSDAEIVP